jgi:hypothetical protein
MGFELRIGRQSAARFDEINAHLKQTGFLRQFPPPGIDVVSWHVMMGIGQVVTLKVPRNRLREVNRARHWGSAGFRSG